MPLRIVKAPASSSLRSVLAPTLIGLTASAIELGGQEARLALRYDRAGIESMELWRLVTGHLAHLGPSHMVMNVLALAVLTFVLSPWLRFRDWLIAGLAAALTIDAGLYWVHTDVTWYVGLSGVLHGLWAAACVRALLARRIEALPLAGLLVAKLAYEIRFGPVPLTGAVAAGPVVTEAHAWGAVGGALVPLLALAMAGRRRSL